MTSCLVMSNIVGYWGSRCSGFSAGSDSRFRGKNGSTDGVIPIAGSGLIFLVVIIKPSRQIETLPGRVSVF